MKFLDAIIQTAWLMEPVQLDELREVAERHERGEKIAAVDVELIVAGRRLRRQEARAEEGRDKPDPKADPKADPHTDPKLGLLDEEDEPQRPAYTMEGSVAVVPIDGVIAPKASMVNGVSRPTGMSIGQIIGNLYAARDDRASKSILLDIDSGGGSDKGLDQVIDAIREVDAVKPVHAYARFAGSAAYWIGMTARSFSVSRSAEVGSIGVYTIVEDTSGLVPKGVKRYMVKAGEFKGAGAPGIPISEKDLGVIGERVNALYQQFVSEVAASRSMTREKALSLAHGRVHRGPAAVALGLADSVALFGEVVRQLNEAPAGRRGVGVSGVGHSGAKRPTEMTMNANDIKTQFPDAHAAIAGEGRAAGLAEARGSAEKPATITELKAAFKDDANFALEAAEKQLTLTQARAEYAGVLQARLADAQKQVKEMGSQLAARAPAAETAPKTEAEKRAEAVAAAGGKGVGFGTGGEGGGAFASFDAAVANYISTEKLSRSDACRKAIREHPGLYQASLQAGVRVSPREKPAAAAV